MKTHRELYPSQYTHPLCGKRVRIKGQDVEGKVLRVVPSRFGLLALLEGEEDMAWHVNHCEVVDG